MTARRSASLESELAGARRELPTLGTSVADAGRELAEARHELEEQRRRNVRAYEAIQYVRRELEQIRAAALEPPDGPTPRRPSPRSRPLRLRRPSPPRPRPRPPRPPWPPDRSRPSS